MRVQSKEPLMAVYRQQSTCFIAKQEKLIDSFHKIRSIDSWHISVNNFFFSSSESASNTYGIHTFYGIKLKHKSNRTQRHQRPQQQHHIKMYPLVLLVAGSKYSWNFDEWWHPFHGTFPIYKRSRSNVGKDCFQLQQIIMRIEK